jgi:hypothetical protein
MASMDPGLRRGDAYPFIIPANAGIHRSRASTTPTAVDPRFRGGDEEKAKVTLIPASFPRTRESIDQ